jgi:HEAT repeat protein
MLAFAQNAADPRQRVREIRELVKQGEDAIPGIAAYVSDPVLDVRLEAVKQIAAIGGPRTLEPLLQFARDNDPEVQVWATDGLVNIYLPGYLRSGISRSVRRAGDSIRATFGDGRNDQIVEPYVMVAPPVVQALGRLARGGTSMESRANAARALGILRGQAALDDLVEALYSKDNQVMFEALVALQKIRDPAAGPKLAFLVRDLEKKIQLAALRAVGVLRAVDAAPDVRSIIADTKDSSLRTEALTALAMIAEPADHDVFVRYLTNRDADLRAAGAEGLARLRNPADVQVLTQAFNDERDSNPRLSMSFALVALGRREMTEFSPLRYLVNTLNRGAYRNVAMSFLTELARDKEVREALYPVLPGATRDEKTGLSIILARSGDRDTVPYLEALKNDSDLLVAEEGLRSLRALEARLR